MCMLHGVIVLQVDAMPTCGFCEVRVGKADRTQHGARRRLGDAVHHHARIATRVVGRGPASSPFAALLFHVCSCLVGLQEPVSAICFSRSATISTPVSVITSAGDDPGGQLVAEQRHAEEYAEQRREHRQRRHAGHRVAMHQNEIPGVSEQAGAEHIECQRSPGAPVRIAYGGELPGFKDQAEDENQWCADEREPCLQLEGPDLLQPLHGHQADEPSSADRTTQASPCQNWNTCGSSPITMTPEKDSRMPSQRRQRTTSPRTTMDMSVANGTPSWPAMATVDTVSASCKSDQQQGKMQAAGKNRCDHQRAHLAAMPANEGRQDQRQACEAQRGEDQRLVPG